SHSKRTIAQVARTSITPNKWCTFVVRLIRYFESKEILELGTSMGIMSLYMGLQPNVRLTTFEGNPAMVDIALHNFTILGTNNIKLVEGNIDTTLPAYLETTSEKIDLVWMDANHRYEPTVRYFEMLSKRMAEKGIIVVDDIYHSKEMGRAWQKLQRHDSVYGSLDLFRCGILFFDPTLNNQHVICAL
ncbi:MAG: O-methyltransferase, partial [Flammeovirgaceae bacterium]